jgi:hypothetical protein
LLLLLLLVSLVLVVLVLALVSQPVFNFKLRYQCLPSLRISSGRQLHLVTAAFPCRRVGMGVGRVPIHSD